MLFACVATRTTPCETSGCALTSPTTDVLNRRPNVGPETMPGDSVDWFGYHDVRSPSAPCVVPVVDSEDALIPILSPVSPPGWEEQPEAQNPPAMQTTASAAATDSRCTPSP